MEAALAQPPYSTAAADSIRPFVLTNAQLPAREYHAERAHVSSSQLVEILQSPAHYKLHITEGPDEESDLMRLGAGAHCALLEPELFPQRYVYAPRAYDRRRTADREERDAVRAAYPDRVLLSPVEALTLRRIVRGVEMHATARALLQAPGEAELSLFWRDALSGLPLKARVDRFVNVGPRGTLVEVKTTHNAARHLFAARIVDMAYHVRAAMYADGIQKAYGFTPDIVWLVIEPDTGFVATYRPSARMLAQAQRLYERARLVLTRSLRDQRWPAYQDGNSVETIDLPRRARH